jgi:hypothetical protein
MLASRVFACFCLLAVMLALPSEVTKSAPQPTSTPPHTLILLSWKAKDGHWNFDIAPGSGESFKRMSRSQLKEFAAGLAGLRQASAWYTLDRAKSLLGVYSDSARHLYWIGFPHFGNHYADLAQYPPADIIERIRSEAMKHHIELILERIGE